jgi:hypothetical protein
MTVVNLGEPAPLSGLYEQIDQSGKWTGFQVRLAKGELLPPSRTGNRWVWVDPWLTDWLPSR